MKKPLRGTRFRTVPEILQAVDRSIRTINTTGAAKGILRLPHRWQRVVHNAGDCIDAIYAINMAANVERHFSTSSKHNRPVYSSVVLLGFIFTKFFCNTWII